MEKLPNGWQWKTVAELAAPEPRSITDGPFGSKLKTEHYTEAGPRVIRLQNIGDGEFLDAKAHISEEHYQTLKSHKVEAGDVVIAAMGENPPRACIVPETLGPAIVKADCIRFKPDSVHSARFLTYALNSPGTRRRAKAIVHGVGRPRLNQGEIKAIELPVAPPEEQRRIVARIEELFSRLDAGVAALRHAKAQLQRYRQSVLAAAVTGRLTQAWREQIPDTEPANELLKRILEQRREQWNARGKYKDPDSPDISKMPEIPARWQWARLDAICAIGSGMSVSQNRKNRNPIEVPYLRVANVQRGHLLLDEMKRMEIDKNRLSDLALKKGDVLFNEGGDRDKLGRGWIWEGQVESCITQNHVFRASAYDLDATLPKFISHWGNIFGQQFFLDEGTQTTNLASINKGVLSSFPVPIPPIAEQHQIVAEVEARTTAIDHLEAELDRQTTRSNCLRQSTLRSAFSGSL